MAQVAFDLGPVGLVCLNAGVVSTEPGPVWEASPAEWRRVIDINVGGVANGLRSFVPRLLNVGDPAHVLITASLAPDSDGVDPPNLNAAILGRGPHIA